MNRKEYIRRLRSMIEECATSEDYKEQMLDRLEDIDDELLSLELDIEEQYNLKADAWDTPSNAELEEKFNFANRMC